MSQIIDKIEATSEYRFVYNTKFVDLKRKVSIKVEEVNIENVLKDLFNNTSTSYKIRNTQIVLKDKKSNVDMSLSIKPSLLDIKQQKTNISGTITDINGQPLPGANIIEKGTSNGVQTDFDGKFSLEVKDQNATIIISYIGFVSQEIKINNQSKLAIVLQEDAANLDEVVVVGYGSVKKRELTGSVTSMKEEDFNEIAAPDAMQLIQGKVAGLSITRTNGGDPTQGFEIRLRGSSSISASQEPLIVVDGIPGGNLNAIAPEDIASMDILKDGSAAAIYGTRGTNGVILVTTKKGKRGDTQVEFSSKYTTQSILKTLDVLSGDEYRSMKSKLESTRPTVSASMVDYGFDTDWFEEITRNSFSHIQHLSLSGGTDKTTYRLSLYYTDQEGVMLNSSMNELRGSLNLTQRALDDRLKFNVQMGVSDRNENPVNYDAFRQAIKRNPTEPVYNGDGSLFEIQGWQYENPVGQLNERYRDNGSSNLFGNLGLDLTITDWFKVGVVGGIQKYRSLNGYYEPSYSLPQETNGSSGSANRLASVSDTKTLEATVDFNKKIENHSFNATAGYSFQEFINEGFEAENSNFINDDLLYNNLGSGTDLRTGDASMSSFKSKNKLVGFFSRIAYNYKGKYFLSASIRTEGSTKFGANNKWGTFPAISAAWDLTQEDFLKNNSVFDFLKIRVGYGVTGNQGIDPYLSLSRLSESGYFFYNGKFIPGYGPNSNPNPNLKWETKKETNIGLDWSAKSGRIGGTLDYYVRDTEDLLNLYDVPVPPNLYGQTMANVGAMRNSGFEITLNAIPITSKDFKWNMDLNMDYRKNELLSLSNDYYSLEYRNVGGIGSPGVDAWTHRYYEGGSIGNIHGYIYEGLTDDGLWIFKDTDGIDGITIEDRTDIGNGIPDFYAGLTNTFQYKNWDMSFMFRGMFGHQIINHKRIFYENPILLPLNIMSSAQDTELWDNPQFSSYYVENGDFIKLDNLTLGYNLPFKNTDLIKSARIFLTGSNLFVITGYNGIDPEGSIGGLTPGVDSRGDYPSTRTFTLGFNIKF